MESSDAVQGRLGTHDSLQVCAILSGLAPPGIACTCQDKQKHVRQTISRMDVCCSKVQLAHGSELVIFSPGAVSNYTSCQHSCMRLTPSDVPVFEKLTTVPMQGILFLIIISSPPFLHG